MIQNILDKYIEQCLMLCTKPEDYSKANVKRHNKARDILNKYAAELCESPMLAEKVFSQLLKHELVAVRLSSAAHCLKYGMCIESAVEVLKMIEAGEDKLSAFNAEMTLKVWQGQIPGKVL